MSAPSSRWFQLFLFLIAPFGAGGGLADQLPLASRPRPPGALSGKTVFLSPGHGFYHHGTLGWITQRGNNNGLVEDFLNAELALQYLVAYLENAGADVWTCRDRCFSTVEVIVDNGSAGYRESGRWTDTSSGGYGGDGRFATTAATETATAIFTPDVPSSGLYPLYIYFNAGSNRTAAALVRVVHSGGSVSVRVNQQRDGYTWRFIGTFYWLRGTGQSVVISNVASGANVGRVVVADAVRIGGGIGSETPVDGGPTSDRRRADECCVYWARYQGAPESVYDPTNSGDGTDDVTCRPLYAEFESEPGEDSVYISIHSNGGGGTGTETYMYLDGTPSGSERLRALVHTEVVADLRSGWDPGWVDRGVKTANFGELRLLHSMPGILIETAFHDNPADAAAEKEPRWRRLVARAIYHGVARYFRGDGARLLPEPPADFQTLVEGTSAALSWSEPAAGAQTGGAGTASGYRVYRSSNGFAFDSGTPVSGTTYTATGLERGSLVFFRVTATNAGGESFPSATLAVRAPLEDDAPRALIVHGFDGLDASFNLEVSESSALGTVERQFLDRRLNSFDYVVEHATALAASVSELAISSAENEAVVAGRVALENHDLVDWFVGRETVTADTLTPGERAALQGYLGGGGRLFLSGMDIGQDLEVSSSNAARAFFNGWLRATLTADDAGSRSVRAAGVGAFTGQETFELDDGRRGLYDVDRPDAYSPLGGAALALVYGAGGSPGAAVQFAGGYRLVHLGFPLEAVVLRGARDLFARRAVEFLLELPNGPPEATAEALPSSTVALEGGVASLVLDGSASDDGDGGSQGLSYRWRKVAGPPGDTVESPSGWERGPAGFGYGDGDDATVLVDMRYGYASVYLVREFPAAPAGIADLELRVAFDDGFAAYLNGVEVARRNLSPGAGHADLAERAIEPEDEVFPLTPFLAALRTDRNVLAVEVHNAALDSSDLSLAAEIVARTAAGRERLVPAGAFWFFHRGRTPPGPRWNYADFEPTPRRTRVRFTAPGAYRYRLEVDDGRPGGTAVAEVAVTVLPEGGGELFRRGDGDSSGDVDISDAIFTLDWLFRGGQEPACRDAADTNDSGAVDLSDSVAALNWLFLGGSPPPPPGPFACGLDETPDSLRSCAPGACD